jgi:hypothetical protein
MPFETTINTNIGSWKEPKKKKQRHAELTTKERRTIGEHTHTQR